MAVGSLTASHPHIHHLTGRHFQKMKGIQILFVKKIIKNLT